MVEEYYAKKKTVYTREVVVEAGLEQLKANGWEGLSPKSVAKQLRASTAPIFSNFKTMDEFREAILDRAWEVAVGYALKTYTGDAWVDQGIGYVFFARDYGRLFSCMHYGNPEKIRNRRYEFWVKLNNELGDYPGFDGMSAVHVGWIRNVRALLTHGIAVSVSSGLAPFWENDDVIKEMISLCSEILRQGLSKSADKLNEISNKISSDARKRLSGVPLK